MRREADPDLAARCLAQSLQKRCSRESVLPSDRLPKRCLYMMQFTNRGPDTVLAPFRGSLTCSISGMCLWRDTPYAFIPSATSVYRKACFTERPAPLTPLFASMMMSSCDRYVMSIASERLFCVF